MVKAEKLWRLLLIGIVVAVLGLPAPAGSERIATPWDNIDFSENGAQAQTMDCDLSVFSDVPDALPALPQTPYGAPDYEKKAAEEAELMEPF